jgi:predicted metal-dependent phosphoesterase TrpH
MRRAGKAVGFPRYPAVADVIPAVKAAGALVAIAHPRGYFNECDRGRMDALRLECQLDGIECAHPGVPEELTPVYRQYCEDHGLFSTGGSDCHTEEDIAEKFALHGGPDEWLDELLDRLDDR